MLSPTVLELDRPAVIREIEEAIRKIVRRRLRSKGVVVGLSGGVDSSVVAALCAGALGPERVLGLLMPERESPAAGLELARRLARRLGIATELLDVGPALEALGCYRRRDAAIREVVPAFGKGWISKIVLPPLAERRRYNLFTLVVRSPDGRVERHRLRLRSYLAVVAATNMKQRVRKLVEYHFAERLGFAVAGTPNRLEYDQGFFVRYGDGAADLKPIAHLYKSQVYALAEQLGIPEEIRSRPPSTDTYSMPQTQEEFYFALPHRQMDLCLWAYDHAVPPSEIAPVVGLTPATVEQVYRDIESKREAARRLRREPILVEPVEPNRSPHDFGRE